MTEPILRVNSEGSTCVMMKCNAVFPENLYRYYTTLNMLVYLDITVLITKRILRTPA